MISREGYNGSGAVGIRRGGYEIVPGIRLRPAHTRVRSRPGDRQRSARLPRRGRRRSADELKIGVRNRHHIELAGARSMVIRFEAVFKDDVAVIGTDVQRETTRQ